MSVPPAFYICQHQLILLSNILIHISKTILSSITNSILSSISLLICISYIILYLSYRIIPTYHTKAGYKRYFLLQKYHLDGIKQYQLNGMYRK